MVKGRIAVPRHTRSCHEFFPWPKMAGPRKQWCCSHEAPWRRAAFWWDVADPKTTVHNELLYLLFANSNIYLHTHEALFHIHAMWLSNYGYPFAPRKKPVFFPFPLECLIGERMPGYLAWIGSDAGWGQQQATEAIWLSDCVVVLVASMPAYS